MKRRVEDLREQGGEHIRVTEFSRLSVGVEFPDMRVGTALEEKGNDRRAVLKIEEVNAVKGTRFMSSAP